ncbi:MAG: ABC transporter permease [Gemmatimonadota bacterium]|nr:ABC transporter permease [Gemmatimonadota bacterium]
MLLALRRLIRRPWYTATSLVTIALSLSAVGIATALVRDLWLAPSTGFAAQRLVRIWESSPDALVPLPVSLPRVQILAQQARSLDGVAAYSSSELTLQGQEAVRLPARVVTHNFFDLYGVRLLRGRDFDAELARSRVVILSEQTWTEEFGRSEALIGRSVNLNGTPSTVIGIAPAGLPIPDLSVRLWVPLEPEFEYLSDASIHRVQVIGRLRSGATVEQLRQELGASVTAVPGDNADHRAEAERLDHWLYGDARGRARWLVLAAACLLLVALANWSSLAMTRSIGLSREMAIREALGASRMTGWRYVFIEQATLAALAFPLALWVAFAVSAALGAILEHPGRSATTFDIFAPWPITVMALAACTAVMMVSLATRRSRHPTLDVELRTSAGTGSRRRVLALNLVVATEVAAAVVLSSVAANLLRRHAELSAVDPGFRTEGLVVVPMTLAGTSYRSSREVAAFYRRAQEEVGRHPSVSEISAIDGLPLGESPGEDELLVEGAEQAGKWEGVRLHNALGDYFKVSGITIREGRDFRRMEDPSVPVAIVSETLSRTVWGGRSPLGSRIRIARYGDEPWRLVIGVAADVRNLGLASQPGYIVYEPHSQFPRRQMTLLVRGTSDRALDPAAVLGVLRSLDPGVPIQRPQTFNAVVDGMIDTERREARAASTVAILVVVLACAGIIGMVSYLLAMRRREMALKAAIGASPRWITVHALSIALKPTLIGTLAGTVMTLLLTAGVGLADLDLGTFYITLGSGALVFLAAILAASPTALRSARIAPAELLRNLE